MKKFISEFKAFAIRGNMMDMAVGIIIGGAFTAIVTSLSENFIKPILNFVTGGATYTLQEVAGFASSFLTAIIISSSWRSCSFCLLKGLNKLDAWQEKRGRKRRSRPQRSVPSARVKLQLTLRDVLTVTSILLEETEDNQEGSKIAEVFVQKKGHLTKNA